MRLCDLESVTDGLAAGLAGTYRRERTSGGVERGRLLPAARTLAIIPTNIEEEIPVGLLRIGISSNKDK